MTSPPDNLSEFIRILEQNKELIRIKEEVSCDLEITEITDRVSKSGELKNKALLFENVKDSSIPVLINSLGSYKRLKLAFGVNELEEISQRIENFLNFKVPEGLANKLALLPKYAELIKFPPKLVKKQAPCQEIVIKNNSKNPEEQEKILDKLPILKCWPGDGGKFITLPLVFTKDPRTQIRNIGMYRMQKFSNTRTGFHVHWHHDAAESYSSSEQEADKDNEENPNNVIVNRDSQEILLHGQNSRPKTSKRFGTLRKIPVAVAIGADPCLVYAATAPLPSIIDETIFAGFLRKKPIELVKCKTIDLEVPAQAEIILEGYVNLDELAREGPFGDHTGFYSLAGDFPVFEITALTHRKNPVYMTTIVGKPPQEDCYLGKATERIFLPLLKIIMPDVLDLNLPLEGVFHNCIILKIKKRYPGQAKKIINAVWGSGQLSFSKFVIVLDHDVDIHNLSEVAWKVFANTDPKRDTVFTEGPVDILDHASTLMGFGGKMGIDATIKWKSEGFPRDWPKEITMNSQVKQEISERFSRLFK